MATVEIFDAPGEPGEQENGKRFSLRRLTPFLKREQHWLLVLIPLLLTLIMSGRWLADTWIGKNDAIGFQPFVLLGVAYLIYAERHDLSHTYHSLAEVYPENSKMRRGTPVVAYLGCVILFLSYVTAREMFTVIGFLIATIGVLLYVYGFTILRGLWRPFLFAITMIPPPDVIINLATALSQGVCAIIGGAILHLFYPQSNTVNNFVTVGSYTAQVSGNSGGIGVLLPVGVATLFLCLLRKIRWTITLILLVSSALISLLVNTLRVVIMGVIGVGNPALADWLHDANSFVFAALAFYLTYLLAERIGPRRSVVYDDDEWEDE